MTNFTYIIGRNSFKNKSIFIIFRKKDFGNNITKGAYETFSVK